jgi:site-specific recombinase XerD
MADTQTVNPIQRRFTMNTVSTQHFFNHIDGFIDYRKTVYDISEQTLKSNKIDINLFKEFLDMKNYHAIDGKAVMDFQYYLRKERLNQGASMNRKIFTLKSYAQYLKLEDIPHVNNLPFNDVLKCRQGYRSAPNVLSENQITRLFESIDTGSCLGIRDYAVYAMMYKLGLRVGQVHALNLEHIDFKNNKLTVIGKGQKKLTTFLDAQMKAILIQWIAVRKQFINSELSQALFLSKKGNRLAIRTIEDNFKKLVAKLDFKDHFHVTCHTLRHSLASHLNDNGVDVLVIQHVLGHSTPKTTMDYYIHPSEKKIREALEKLPGVIFMNQLVKAGVIQFQSSYYKRE